MTLKRKKPRGKSAHQELVEEADAWVTAIVVHRQGGLCLRCHKPLPLSGCHILRKGGIYNRIRFEFDNVIGMDSGCHIGWAHNHEYDFYQWIEGMFPGRLEDLKLRARMSRKIDVRELICILRDIYSREVG
jgi:hypothetical protein